MITILNSEKINSDQSFQKSERNIIKIMRLIICLLIVIGSDIGSFLSIEDAYEFSTSVYKTSEMLKYQLINDGFVVSKGQPGSVFFIDEPLDKNVSELYKKSSILIKAEQLFNELNISSSSHLPISNEDKVSLIRSISESIPLSDRCRVVTQNCSSNEKYRSINGYCNNLRNPFSGSRNAPFTRLAPAVYDDGFHSVRRNSVTNGELVSAMTVGRSIPPPNAAIQTINYGGITFGQLMAHDLGLRALIQSDKGGSSIRCCSSDYSKRLPVNLMNDGCYPIDLEESILFYKQYNITCMNFIRSQPIFSNDCKLGAAEQANAVTHFLDVSNIYGSESKITTELRSFLSGKLKVNDENLLPKNPDKSVNYYLAGDTRSNQHPTIALLASVFVRLHNRFAEKLADLNSHWDDNKLFNETRRITIAIYQHIVYNEWLPIFIGEDYNIEQNITCENRDIYCGKYEPDLEPGTYNEFSQGVYRIFHNFVPNVIELYTENKTLYHTYPLSSVLQKPELLQNSFDGFLYGMFYEPNLFNISQFNSVYQFFNNYNKYGVGISLFSHDIQRGRDHGLAPYYVYQEMCIPESSKVKNWTDLEINIAPAEIDKLKQNFDTVFDVDLIAGLTAEININAYLGKVGRCLMAKQFITTKNADRFFYSFAENPYPLTKAQLKEINQYWFSNLICDTTDARIVPEKGFILPDSSNKMVECDDLYSFDLSSWQE